MDKARIPLLDTAKLAFGGLPGNQMTTREEQEQYRLQGIQDGKVEELINYEKMEDQRKLIIQQKVIGKNEAKTTQEEDQAPQDPSASNKQGPRDFLEGEMRQTQQDKKKKRKAVEDQADLYRHALGALD